MIRKRAGKREFYVKWEDGIKLGTPYSSSNIPLCKVPSRVTCRWWFNDSWFDIDFYQIFFQHSESTILQESIISKLLTLCLYQLANSISAQKKEVLKYE